MTHLQLSYAFLHCLQLQILFATVWGLTLLQIIPMKFNNTGLNLRKEIKFWVRKRTSPWNQENSFYFWSDTLSLFQIEKKGAGHWLVKSLNYLIYCPVLKDAASRAWLTPNFFTFIGKDKQIADPQHPCTQFLQRYENTNYIGHVNNIPTKQFFTEFPEILSQNHIMLSLPECVWDFQKNALWDTL